MDISSNTPYYQGVLKTNVCLGSLYTGPSCVWPCETYMYASCYALLLVLFAYTLESRRYAVSLIFAEHNFHENPLNILGCVVSVKLHIRSCFTI